MTKEFNMGHKLCMLIDMACAGVLFVISNSNENIYFAIWGLALMILAASENISVSLNTNPHKETKE